MQKQHFRRSPRKKGKDSTTFLREFIPVKSRVGMTRESRRKCRADGLFDAYVNPMEPGTSWELVISLWMPTSLGWTPKARPINWVM